MNIDYKNVIRSVIIPLIVVLPITQLSCKKLVEANVPSNIVEQSNVYSSDGTAIAVLTGIYRNMTTMAPPGAATIDNMSLMFGLSADEFILYNGVDLINLIDY